MKEHGHNVQQISTTSSTSMEEVSKDGRLKDITGG